MESTIDNSPGPSLHKFIWRRRLLGEQVFGIVDSARDRKLARSAWFRYHLPTWTLFDSNVSPQMADVAPYLVAFQHHLKYPYPGSGYLDLWNQRIGNSASILLFSDAHPRTLWEHLNGLFTVVDEEGNMFFFRYYDPRVLREFLPTCTKKQTLDFFGPINCIMVESETPNSILEYTCGLDGLHTEVLLRDPNRDETPTGSSSVDSSPSNTPDS